MKAGGKKMGKKALIIGCETLSKIINFEDKEQETEEKIENQTEEEMGESEDSENNRKKVRYEDGTWKFF